MTEKSRRQLVMLVALVVLLAVVLWMRRDGTPATGGGTPSNSARGAAAPAVQQTTVADVRLEALNAARDALAPAARNPFRFEQRPAPAASRPATAPQRPAVTAPPVPAGPPPPPPIPLKFIGVLDAPSRIGRVAILSDSRGNVFYGKEGDIIDGRYQVMKIGAESADLAYSDGRGRQTIRLSGQ